MVKDMEVGVISGRPLLTGRRRAELVVGVIVEAEVEVIREGAMGQGGADPPTPTEFSTLCLPPLGLTSIPGVDGHKVCTC